MIPDKRKTKREYVTGDTIKLSTDAQRLAQVENFALFQLKGIQSQLKHLMDVPGIGTINVEKIRRMCVQMEKNIKQRQAMRRTARAVRKHTENPNG